MSHPHHHNICEKEVHLLICKVEIHCLYGIIVITSVSPILKQLKPGSCQLLIQKFKVHRGAGPGPDVNHGPLLIKRIFRMTST